MIDRISIVDYFKLITVDETSVIEMGDSQKVNPKTNVLALQREEAIFFQNELPLTEYQMYREPIPQPIVDDEMLMTTCNETPFICVHKVNISFVAASTVIQFGSAQEIKAEARVKNIRHFLRDKNDQA